MEEDEELCPATAERATRGFSGLLEGDDDPSVDMVAVDVLRVLLTGSILLAKCRRTRRCCAAEEGTDEVVLVPGDDTIMEGAED